MKIAVHITHESVKKIGGIGAVLQGLCTTQAYQGFFDKTLFYGPLFKGGGDILSDFTEAGEILFSSSNGKDRGDYGKLFHEIMQKYAIDILYGKRELVNEFDPNKRASVDVVLVETRTMNPVELAKFKYRLWEKFAIQSDLYPYDWDYEQYLRIAVPFMEILERLYGADGEYYHFAHEYMGVPSVLSVIMAGKTHQTIFVAHEVSTARFEVESHPGHDISFYNILRKAGRGRSLEEVFGSQKQNPRNELIKRAVNFDHIFAVSDLVKDEYLFLVPDAPAEKIKTVYNGLSVKDITWDEKNNSRKRIEKYWKALLDFVPDVIFTHICRMVISKGLWRDISLLYCLDDILSAQNLKGAYILLSTLIATGRPPEDILKMEKEYGWPVVHREGWPDLVGMEAELYKYLEIFNAQSKAIKGLFINQFGFDRKRCGVRVPEDAEFNDLRIASDAEFGFSLYEPFGIAHLEALPFGGVSLISSCCGCKYFLQKIFKDAAIKPFYVVDFINAAKEMNYEELKELSRERRTKMERELFSSHAQSIFEILPLGEAKKEEYLENARQHNPALGWEYVVENYFLPNLST